MKNLFTIAFLSSVMMISCSKENETTTTTQKSTKFYASIEASETRTYVDTNCKQFWSANDLITLFRGDTHPRKYQYDGPSGSNDGAFNEIDTQTENISTNTINANYAIYPYDGSTTISEDGKISYTLPAIQNYAENSFGLGANTMIAVTKNTDDNYLNFKNIGGYFEFALYGKDITVKSIEIKGNNGEKLAGTATITATYNSEPIMNFADSATETLTLDCGENGVEVGDNEGNATKFWVVVPAKEYSKGITITITNVDGSTMKKSTSNSILIKRSTVQPLEAFEVIPTTPPYNQIWYTTTNNNPITCGYTNVISHGYDNGKGVITFDSNITWIKHYAFQLCTSLKSITIPNSVESIGQEAFYKCI